MFDTISTIDLLKRYQKPKNLNESIRKIYIFSYEPYHFYFDDYIKSISYYIPNMTLILYSQNNFCYKYIKENNIINSIIIFLQYFVIIRIQPNFYYLLNTEQLSVPKWFNCMKEICDKKINIIDYSNENIKILKKYDKKINIFHLPYLYNPNEKFYDPSSPKLYDVGLISTVSGLANSKRRTNIYNKLSKLVKVNLIGGFKDIRDNELAKCKLLINIHFKETFKILEVFRCYRCIYNKMLIVSEEQELKNTYYLDKYIIYSEYDTIIETVVDVLKNYDAYYNKIFNNYDENIIKNNCENIARNFINIQ